MCCCSLCRASSLSSDTRSCKFLFSLSSVLTLLLPKREPTLSAMLVAAIVAAPFSFSVCTSILLNNLSGNIQQTDVRFRVGFLSSGDTPNVAVKERLQVIGSSVLYIRIRQTREHRKDEQIPYKFIVGVLHRCVHERLYLLLGKVAPIDAFERVDVPCKGIERQTPVVPRYGNDMFQHNQNVYNIDLYFHTSYHRIFN